MKIVFLLPGTDVRPNIINGDTIRYGKASSSGTDQSVILVAEYLAKQGHDVTIVLDKTDKSSCRGVTYTDFTYEGLHNSTVDVLVSMLWFTKYEEIPFRVTKGLIYWFHMAWIYGIKEIIEFCKKQNLQLSFVNPSKWSQEQNSCWINLAKKEFSNVADLVIPNPIMTELFEEITNEEVITRIPKSSIFHAQHARGGAVADKAIEKLNWEPSYKFDYTNHQNGVDKKTVFKKLLETDYFIFPLYHPNGCVYKDTFSCSVAEAIAAGVIVITYPLGAFPEYFSSGCSFLEFPAETDLPTMLSEKVTCNAEYMSVHQNIVERLTYLEANPHLKEEIRNQSKDLIKEQFSIRALGQRWHNLVNTFDIEPCNIKDYVSGSLYINLPSREDRKKEFEAELQRVKLNGVERVDAIQLTVEENEIINKNGGWIHPPSEEFQDRIDRLNDILIFQRSCTESHKKAVKVAKDNNWDNVLIFEDDCRFTTTNIKEVLTDVKEFINSNNNWDLIFLGVNLKHVPEKYNERFYKLNGRFYTTHAYLINKRFYDTLLSYEHKTCCNIDVLYTDLASTKEYFLYHKLFAIQKTGFSDIERLKMKYDSDIIYNFYINTRRYTDKPNYDKIGFFYQTSKNPCATFMNLQQLKQYYPTSPIVVWEDITTDCKQICKHFEVPYKTVYRLPDNSQWKRSKPITEINGGLYYLHRLYSSCVNELSGADWIMHYEDDVWCAGHIKNLPNNDWGGTLRTKWSEELTQYMREDLQIEGDLFHGACGGSLISREAIIKSYTKLQEIDWVKVLEKDPNVGKYSDYLISFMLLVAGYKWSQWEDWEQGSGCPLVRSEKYKIYTKPFIHNIKYWYDYPYNVYPTSSLDKLNEEREDLKFFIENNQYVNL